MNQKELNWRHLKKIINEKMEIYGELNIELEDKGSKGICYASG